jgi:hypothetical protein
MWRMMLIVVLMASQVLNAQRDKKPECVLEMQIPDRLMIISASTKEVVYRDKKTNAILTFTKVCVTDYGFDLNFNADQVYQELKGDPSYKDANIIKHVLGFADCYILNWSNSEYAPNRKNDCKAMAMMDVCGQYYTFEFSLPGKKKDDVLFMFNEILASISTSKQ